MREILVFLIPYVIPMPRESILLERDNNNELINIRTPPKVSYVEKRILLKSHKQSTSYIEFKERGIRGRSLKSLLEGKKGQTSKK